MFGDSVGKMKVFLDKNINSNNIVDFLDAYDDQGAKKGDSSIIDTITSETGASAAKQKAVLIQILRTLSVAAKKAGVSDSDIKKANDDFTKSMNKEFGDHFKRTNPKDMEKAITFLKGCILAKQNSTEEVDEMEAAKTLVEDFGNVNKTATDDFETARKDDAWYGKGADTVLGWFGCNTIEDLRAKLGKNAKGVESMMKALENNDIEAFKKAYTNTFGVGFDANKIAARDVAMNKYEMAAGNKIGIEATDKILKSNLSEDEIKTQLQQLGFKDEEIEALVQSAADDNTIDTSTANGRKSALMAAVKSLNVTFKSEFQKLSNGKSIEQMQADFETLSKAAFGTNDIAKDVAQFNGNQQMTEMMAEMLLEIAATVALEVVTAGAYSGIAAARMAAMTAKMASTGSKAAKLANFAQKIYNIGAKIHKLEKGSKIAHMTGSVAKTAVATAMVDASGGKSTEYIVHKALMNASFAVVGSGSAILGAKIAPKVTAALVQKCPQFSALSEETAQRIISEAIETAGNTAGSAAIITVQGQEYTSEQALIDTILGAIMARVSHMGGAVNEVKGAGTKKGVGVNEGVNHTPAPTGVNRTGATGVNGNGATHTPELTHTPTQTPAPASTPTPVTPKPKSTQPKQPVQPATTQKLPKVSSLQQTQESAIDYYIKVVNEYERRHNRPPLSPERIQKIKKLNMEDIYGMTISTEYLNIREARYNIDSRYEQNIGNITTSETHNTFVRNENGWNYRFPKGYKNGKSIDRVSLNVVPNKDLIKSLDDYFASGKIKGYYKTPEDLWGWGRRHDPITIYFNEKVTQEVLDDIVSLSKKHIRTTDDVLIGQKIAPGVALDRSPDVAELQAIINQAEAIDPILANVLRTSSSRGFAKDALRGDYTLHTSAGQVAAVKRLINKLEGK